MRIFQRNSPLAVMALAFGTSAGAFDFKQADTLFGQRENNPSAIASARAIYQKALDENGSKDDMLYAAYHLSRLDYYEGELLTPENEHGKRVEIFERCMANVDKVGPQKFGETGTYFYWKTTCLALWGKSASWFSAAFRVGELKGLMQNGLRVDPNFEGGGMQRVIASIKVRASSISCLRDPQSALTDIDAAIAKGPQFYIAHIIKAGILKALNRNVEGVKLLEATKREIETKARNNQLPAGYEPEARAYLKQIRTVLAGG